VAAGQHDDQAGAIAAGASNFLRSARNRAHLVSALLAAIDRSEQVTALIYASESAAAAESALMSELGIDRRQASTVLMMQQFKLAHRERTQLAEEYQAVTAQIEQYEAIINSPQRQHDLVGTDLGKHLAKRAQDTEDLAEFHRTFGADS
jgi:DNA gyrase subunit A